MWSRVHHRSRDRMSRDGAAVHSKILKSLRMLNIIAALARSRHHYVSNPSRAYPQAIRCLYAELTYAVV